MPPSFFVWGDSVMPPNLSTTTLELLQNPYAFTQTRLLSPEDFIREAGKRGVRLDREQLELLHRRRVLQPFYKVHSRPVTDPVPSRSPSGFYDSALREVRFALAQGHLSDPACRPFTPWPGPQARTSLWYSYNQLLVLRPIPYVLAQMQAHPTEDRPVLRLTPLEPQTKEVFARERSLAFLVEALTTKYRPRVVRAVQLGAGNDAQDLIRLINSDEDPPGLGQIELSSDALVEQADRLLFAAESFDPLGPWSRVVRMADSRRWEDLRYDALLAHDYRIAAELLFRHVEHQAHLGATDPPDEPPTGLIHPRQQRLRIDDRERAETVMRFGISDRPALVLAVEGHAEYEIAPRVLDMLGYDPSASRITIVNLEGIKGDLRLLARSVAVPRLDSDGDRYSRLFSPLTSLMVVVDPEPPFESSEGVEAKKNQMIDSVWNSLPPALQSDARRRELAQLLHVHCWPQEFEFAHWTDSELAEALQDISQDAAGIPLEELASHIGRHRDASDAIRKIWAKWRRPPSKPELARVLWPVLERRIQEAPAPEEIPIVHVIQQAISIVHRTQRVNAMAPPDTPPQQSPTFPNP